MIVTWEDPDTSKDLMMAADYYPLEKHLRDLPLGQEEVTLTFERIEQILKEQLPSSAYEEPDWWRNQTQGMQVETISWMDAGWLVETVDLEEKWVCFVRQ
jgi:hypothetical protein